MTQRFTCFGHINDTRVQLVEKGISVGDCPSCPTLAECVSAYDARAYDPDVESFEEDKELEEDELF